MRAFSMPAHIASCVAFITAFLSLAGTAEARPFRGSTPVFVILCQTSDSGAAPQTAAHYRNLLVNRGTGGLADFWGDVTYGNFNNDGSSIHGWRWRSKCSAIMLLPRRRAPAFKLKPPC